MRKARRATRPKTSLTPDWRAVRADVAAAVGLGITFLLLYGLTAAPPLPPSSTTASSSRVVAYTWASPTPPAIPSTPSWVGWSPGCPGRVRQGVNLLVLLRCHHCGRRLRHRAPAELRTAPGRAGGSGCGAIPGAVVPGHHRRGLYPSHYLPGGSAVAGPVGREAQTRWRTGVRRAYPLAVVVGLSLTHHRMAFLLLPPLLAYLWWAFGRRFRPRHWRNLAGLALLPLLLYAYLPLRNGCSPPHWTAPT